MTKEDIEDKSIIGDGIFIRKWLSKLLFTLISVKVWGLAASIGISTYLLCLHQGGGEKGIGISGAQWVTFNTTVWALIFGMKEIFRISGKKDKAEIEIINETNKTEIEKERIKAREKATAGGPIFTPEGKEIVGDNPDV